MLYVHHDADQYFDLSRGWDTGEQFCMADQHFPLGQRQEASRLHSVGRVRKLGEACIYPYQAIDIS